MDERRNPVVHVRLVVAHNVERDCEAVAHCANSGVTIIAAIHAANQRELEQKPFARQLLQTGAFSQIAFLSGRAQPGKIAEMIEARHVHL